MQFYYQSPLGIILLESEKDSITGLKFIDEAKDEFSQERLENQRSEPVIQQCAKELDEYFSGKRKEFQVQLQYDGTPFQMRVWDAFKTIGYGETVLYNDIALQVGEPRALRAVGVANLENKICIIIPCHRVVGINGALIGYSGKLWRKEWLLAHEKIYK